MRCVTAPPVVEEAKRKAQDENPGWKYRETFNEKIRDWSVQNGGAHLDTAAAAKVSFTRKNGVKEDEKTACRVSQSSRRRSRRWKTVDGGEEAEDRRPRLDHVCDWPVHMDTTPTCSNIFTLSGQEEERF